ncbi:MAG: PAS domain S-box protein [Chloroflexi bacterium]|nr:PAS domain S-box protein [Chloroflexota bacterium]
MKLEFKMKTAISFNENLYSRIFESAAEGVILSDLESNLVVEANPAACKMHGYSCEEFIGLNATAFIHPKSWQAFHEYMLSFRSGNVFDVRLLHLRQDGSSFHAEWSGTKFDYEGRPCLLGVVRDVTRGVQAEQNLHQRVEIRNREQVKLLEISHTLASTMEFQPGLILDQLREIVEYTNGGLFTLEASTLVTLAMRGAPELERSSPFRIQLRGTDALATLFNGHRPIRIADVGSDNPQANFLRSLLDDGAAQLLAGMQSWMWVPLAVKNRVIGGLGVAHENRNFFTPHHSDLALSVANQAAITMINAELYGHAQALAVLEERQRLARNLHDAVNQSLFSAGLIAEVLPRLWDRDQAEARRSLDDLRRLTRGAMAEMRALLAELRPDTLIDTELGELLILLGNAFTGRTNIPVKVTVTGEGILLPGETQVSLYRICQEALTNIAKHAQASRVEVEIHYIKPPAELELHIRDNGHGFVTSELSPSGHYGLKMMRERAEAVGANFSVISHSGRGTEITVRLARQESL